MGYSMLCDVTGIRSKTAGTDGGNREDHIFYHAVCDSLHRQCDRMGDLQERI